MIEKDMEDGTVGPNNRCDTLHTARNKVRAARSSSTRVRRTANRWLEITESDKKSLAAQPGLSAERLWNGNPSSSELQSNGSRASNEQAFRIMRMKDRADE